MQKATTSLAFRGGNVRETLMSDLFMKDIPNPRAGEGQTLRVCRSLLVLLLPGF